ncbi:GAF and ANTAR domain-containing protein [Streptomyces chrestomyceticus]|uniref:GAF and ANTAR domain-containing protein n=1 Tax=Streptomyces chrestomyceticus TaxID=68185 RepID=UPI0033EF104F
MSREEAITRTFVELADTLVDDFDVIDFLQHLTTRCREIFTLADAAVLLAYPGPDLHSPAPCDPSPALSKVLDLALREGPARDAYRAGATVAPGDLARAPADWNNFTTQARAAGYTHACAVPLRLRRQTLGSLLLLSTTPAPLPADDLLVARGFADAAAIGLLNARTLEYAESLNDQLHTALHSRIVIEQAKGFLASQRRIPLNAAFETMRHHARQHCLRLTTVAHNVITTGQLPQPPNSPPTSQRPGKPTRSTPYE